MLIVKDHKLYESEDLFNQEDDNLTLDDVEIKNNDINSYDYNIEITYISFPLNIRKNLTEYFDCMSNAVEYLDGIFDNIDFISNISDYTYTLDPSSYSIHYGYAIRRVGIQQCSVNGLIFNNPKEIINTASEYSSQVSLNFKFSVNRDEITYNKIFQFLKILYVQIPKFFNMVFNCTNTIYPSQMYIHDENSDKQLLYFSKDNFDKIIYRANDKGSLKRLKTLFSILLDNNKEKTNEYYQKYLGSETSTKSDDLYSGNNLKILQMFNIKKKDIDNGKINFYKENDLYIIEVPEKKTLELYAHSYAPYGLIDSPEAQKFRFVIKGTLKFNHIYTIKVVEKILKLVQGDINKLVCYFSFYNFQANKDITLDFGKYNFHINIFECIGRINDPEDKDPRTIYPYPIIKFNYNRPNKETYYEVYWGKYGHKDVKRLRQNP